jgi:hypothetical protein
MYDPYSSPRYGGYTAAQASPGGMRRLPYFGAALGLRVLSAIMVMSLFPENLLLIAGLGLVFAGGGVYLGYHRLKNAALDPWLSMLLLVPFANLWIGWRCLACQENYGRSRKLDKAGRVVTRVILGCVGFVVVGAIITAIGASLASSR